MAELTDPRLPKGTSISDGVGLGGEPVVVVKHPLGRSTVSIVHTEDEAMAMAHLYGRVVIELRRRREQS
jgi:hypothetical protein